MGCAGRGFLQCSWRPRLLLTALQVSAFTIHGTPKLSVNMPNDEVQKVLASGICTPIADAAYSLFLHLPTHSYTAA